MNKNLFTYKKSGVNINAADRFVKYISKVSSKKRGKKKLNNIGGFGSISNIPKNIKNPKIIAKTIKKLFLNKKKLNKLKKKSNLAFKNCFNFEEQIKKVDYYK